MVILVLYYYVQRVVLWGSVLRVLCTLVKHLLNELHFQPVPSNLDMFTLQRVSDTHFEDGGGVGWGVSLPGAHRLPMLQQERALMPRGGVNCVGQWAGAQGKICLGCPGHVGKDSAGDWGLPPTWRG